MTEPFEGATTLRRIADYQFGRGAGNALFSAGDDYELKRSSSDRIRQVRTDDGHVVSVGVDGRFTLGIEGGRRLARSFEPPACRVAVNKESVPFVREGRNAFARFVTGVDPEIRPGDEVCVVHDGTVLGVGRAELSAGAMADFDTGMAVMVRDGAD